MGPGGFDMQQIFAAAQQALSAQQELANSEVTGTAGGGAVRAVVSGVGQLIDVTIDPSVIDPADPAESAATIADLVLAAVRDAWDSAVDLQQRQLGALGGGFGGAPAGFDLSSLGLPSFGGPLGLAGDEDDEDDDEDEDDEDEDFDEGEGEAEDRKD
jgi:nucleoid-associated protein EbfC